MEICHVKVDVFRRKAILRYMALRDHPKGVSDGKDGLKMLGIEALRSHLRNASTSKNKG